MHSLLSLLFSFSLAGLIYGVSLFPTASLGQTEETEELVSRIGRETGAEQGTSYAANDRGEETEASRDSDLPTGQRRNGAPGAR
ncbi:MAG: hypothetical protein AB7E84_21165 [Xanthobacteraceae bacterium]